ncbi:hypothetical protein H4219_006428, partial [Mycoemilia scoparia]
VKDKRIGVVLQSTEVTLAVFSTPFLFQGHAYRWHSDHGPLIPITITTLPLAIVYSRIKAALRTYGQVLNLSKLYTVDGDWLGNWTAMLSTSPDTECPPSIKFHGIEGLFNIYQSTGLTPCSSYIATGFSEDNERVEIEIPFSKDKEFFAPTPEINGSPDIDVSSLLAALENADAKCGLTRAEIPPNTDKSTRHPRSAKLPINYKERGVVAK